MRLPSCHVTLAFAAAALGALLLGGCRADVGSACATDDDCPAGLACNRGLGAVEGRCDQRFGAASPCLSECVLGRFQVRPAPPDGGRPPVSPLRAFDCARECLANGGAAAAGAGAGAGGP